MTTLNGVAKVRHKATGQIVTAVYAANRLGNKQYNVDGRFLSDKLFNRLYEFVPDDAFQDLVLRHKRIEQKKSF